MSANTVEKKQTEKFLVLPMIALALAQMGTSGDTYVLNVATRSILEELGANMNQMQIATMVYALMASCFMMFGGMLGIKIGWNKNIKLGALLCAAGELVAALSPSILVFTWCGRVLTGIGGSLLIPSVFGTIVAIYKGQNRIQAFGYLSAAVGLAYGIPLLAGAAVDKVGWRYVYAGMGVYFFITFLFSMKIPEIKREASFKLDYVGTVLYAIGIFITVFSISNISTWGLWEPINPPFTCFGISPALPGLIVGIIFLVILVKMEVKIEKNTGSALIPKSFFENKQIAAGLLLNVIPYALSGAVSIVVIPYMQLVAGYSSLTTGFLLFIGGIVMFICSAYIPKAIKGKSIKKLILVSSVVGIVAFLLLRFSLKADTVSIPIYMIGYILFCIMTAIYCTFSGPIVSGAMSARDAQQSGGIQPTSRNIGSTIGIGFIGMIMLVSMNGTFAKELQNTEISKETKAVVENTQMSLMSDDALTAIFETQNVSEKDMEVLLAANSATREKSASYSLYASAVLLLVLGAYAVKHIPDKLEE